MPTDLEDALDPGIVSMMENWAAGQSEYRYIHAVIKAARRVANPDFDAIDKSADEYAKLWGFNPSMIRQIMHLGAVQALGITEDTHK